MKKINCELQYHIVIFIIYSSSKNISTFGILEEIKVVTHLLF